MIHHPTCDEIVVVCVEGAYSAKFAEADVFVGAFIDEGFVLENCGAVGGCASRNNEDASINGIGGCYLEVVTLEIEAAKDIPEAGQGELWDGAAHSLACADAANMWVFERREDAGEEFLGPKYMVVAQHCESSSYLEDHWRLVNTPYVAIAGEVGGGEEKGLDRLWNFSPSVADCNILPLFVPPVKLCTSVSACSGRYNS